MSVEAAVARREAGLPEPRPDSEEAANQRTTSTPDRPGPIKRLRLVWHYRELLGNLVRKDLSIKYKNSILGFAWSLLNPVLYLAVFYVVFQVVLQSGMSNFQIFLLSGILVWTLFSGALSTATTSIVANAPLVTKVWFPREILPFAAVGAAIVNFFLQSIVLIGALLIFQWAPAPEYVPILVPALLALALLAAAFGLVLSALNVRLRDTQHLLELALLAWFWLTPIVYPYQQLASRMGRWSGLLLLNPVTDVVLVFQRALYNRIDQPSTNTQILPDASTWWYLRNVLFVFVAAIVVMGIALRIFGRLEDDLAEAV